MINISKLIKSVILVLGIILILLLYYFLRENFGFSLDCMLYKYTGLYCPGCGVTRMCVHLLHGEIYKAFRSNMAAFTVIIPLGICIISMFYEYIFETKVSANIFKIRTLFLQITICVLISFGILRNIPIFSFLAPVGF